MITRIDRLLCSQIQFRPRTEAFNLVVGGQDPLFVQYNQSLTYDSRFWLQDIRGSIAFARANSHVGILTADEFAKIESGFNQVAEEWRTGKFQARESDEDIHTANERRLGEIIGKGVAGKLHTGRSRNDQVATDMRLWLREELYKLKGYLQDFLEATAARAEQEIDHLCPGIPTSDIPIFMLDPLMGD